MLEGTRAQAELHGVELTHADAENDDSRQLLAISQFVASKVDALVINPTNSQAVQPGIEIANRARIPAITIDRKAGGGKVIAHIASDNIAGGRLAGEHIARKLAAGGAIAEFEGIPGTSVSYERGKGFNEIIAKNHSLRIEVREVANFNRETARDSMARLLARGQAFDAVFAHNDNMILGVLDALRQANPAKRPILVGFDAIPEALQALRDGDLSATVAQKPERMGALAVDLSLKALRDEPVPGFVPVELDLIEASR
jgi:ribose transport system substrate-binding protein